MPSKHADPNCLCRKCDRKRRFAPVMREKEEAIAREEFKEFCGDSNFMATPVRKFGGKASGRKKSFVPRTGPTPEYLTWRLSVLIRDGHKCVRCGATEQLDADHIQPQALYPELRFDVNNGRTLCRPCHRLTPTYGSRVRKLISYREESS